MNSILMMKKNSVDSFSMNGQNLNIGCGAVFSGGVTSRDYAPVFTEHQKQLSFFKGAPSPAVRKSASGLHHTADITRISYSQNPVRREKPRKAARTAVYPLYPFLRGKFHRAVHRSVAVARPIFPRKTFVRRLLPPLYSFGLYAAAALLVVAASTLATGAISSSVAKWRLSSFARSVPFSRDTALTGNMYGYVLPATERSDSDIPVGNAVLPPVSYQAYTVRSGDSISSITVRFGLRNISTLLSVNGIQNARRLRTGQRLSVPSMDGIVHTVAAGESVAAIAARYSVPETALMDANALESSVLTAGSVLFIPGAAMNRGELRKVLGETFVFPVTGRLTSPYGYRNDPFTGVRKFHTGIDIANARGTPVRAALDGKVSVVGKNGVYGNYVILVHDNNYQTLYAHLDSVSVKKGMYLDSNTVLGKMGNTGYSTGNHLHFSVYKNGSLINPFSVLDRSKLRSAP